MQCLLCTSSITSFCVQITGISCWSSSSRPPLGISAAKPGGGARTGRVWPSWRRRYLGRFPRLHRVFAHINSMGQRAPGVEFGRDQRQGRRLVAPAIGAPTLVSQFCLVAEVGVPSPCSPKKKKSRRNKTKPASQASQPAKKKPKRGQKSQKKAKKRPKKGQKRSHSAFFWRLGQQRPRAVAPKAVASEAVASEAVASDPRQ